MGAEIFIVLVGSIAVSGFARWRGWPAPLLVTAVALVVSLIPFVPSVSIDGHVLLNLVLPPLLYSAALDVSFVSFRREFSRITSLGIGLVVVTTVGVGLVAYVIMPELGIAAALLLGAIVGPPDAVSAAAIGRKLGLPRHVMTVLSGESLINDATSLTLVRVFAAVVAGSAVTVWDGIVEFVLAVVVGGGIGLVFGIVLHQLRLRLNDTVLTGTIGLLLPFAAYAIAEELHGSGVLAVVAMGLFVGFNAPRTSYRTRQQDGLLWKSVDFLLEGFVFAYIGLQLPDVLTSLQADEGVSDLLIALAVIGVVILVRPVYVFVSYAIAQVMQRRRIARWKRAIEAYQRDPESAAARRVRMRAIRANRRGKPLTKERLANLIPESLSVQERAVVSWTGMRGVVTLAMAAALNDLTEGAMSTIHEHVLFVCAFVVTIGTLLVQGLTLAPVIKRLGVSSDAQDARDQRQLKQVRKRTNEIGQEYLRRKQKEWREEFGDETMDRFNRIARALVRVENDTEQEGSSPETDDPAKRQLVSKRLRELSRGWINVRRRVLLEERDKGTLNEEVMRELMTAVDAEELVLDTRRDLRDPQG
ncbi:MAG: cation:proton antiporter [Microbacterium sp.]